MHDRLEHGDERWTVGEVQVQLDGWILERGAAPRAPAQVHGIEVADGRILGVPGLQDLRAGLPRPSGPCQEHPIARCSAPQPCPRESGSTEDCDRRYGPEDREQGESAPAHPRSLIRKRSVSITHPAPCLPHPALVTRILTATGALTGLTHSLTHRDSAPGSRR